ncbi:MAG: aspartate/glutamate racemase family protein [Proteobacteria bacterium]|nr:aspartate/glutamate racemase family protein [Pseudomonadota bacterium]
MSKALGVIMLDTAFERPVGDVGNAESWPFPVLFETVKGATARTIVDGRDDDLLDAFVAAGQELHRRGACALTTSCGFLILRQRKLAGRLALPLATSSLLQIPQVAKLLPAGKSVGVVTYDRLSLTTAHFAEAGMTLEPPVVGLPRDGAFHGLIEGGRPYDRQALERELLQAVEGLIEREPSIGAIVLECTNLPPFSAVIRKRFELPVFDILTLGCWLHAGTS